MLAVYLVLYEFSWPLQTMLCNVALVGLYCVGDLRFLCGHGMLCPYKA